MADANINPNATLQTQGLNVPSAPSTIAQNGFIGNNGFNSTGGLSLASNGTNQQTQTMYAPTGQDNTTIPPVQPTSLNSSNMGITSPIVLPTAPTVSTDGTSNNTSIPSPIPSAESIINTGAAQTGTEAKQQAILDKIASLTGSNSSKTTLENTAENSAGVPALTSTLNDLNTQLEGLNNQSTALQNEFNYTIPNQTQNDAQGRGITTAGLAPITASQLRANQIKQGAIATQALTLKSAIYGAQGKYNIAKDAADKAADAQYDTQQQAIDAQKAQLDALKPTLTKEEKAQADIVTAQLADRQNQIDNAKTDKATIIAMATAALKNNPNDPVAHQAALDALAESNKQQPNLQTALGLVGKYQNDPIATQQAILNLQLTRSQIAKNYGDQTTASQASVAGWVTNIKNGTAKLSDVPSGLKNAVSTGLSQGTSAPSTILATTQASLKELNDMVETNHGFTGAVGFRGLIGTFTGPLSGSSAADFAGKAKQVVNDVVLPNLTLLHGLGRVTDREFQALQSSITSLSIDPHSGTSSLSEGAFKTELKNITDRVNTLASASNTDPNTVSVVAPDGSTGTIPKDQLDGALKAGYKQQ